MMSNSTCEICGSRDEIKNGQSRPFMARYPLDELRCRKWVRNTGIEDLAYIPIETLHASKYVCSNHFEARDFNSKKTQLNSDAVPTLNLIYPPLPDEILSDFPLHLYFGDDNETSDAGELYDLTEGAHVFTRQNNTTENDVTIVTTANSNLNKDQVVCTMDLTAESDNKKDTTASVSISSHQPLAEQGKKEQQTVFSWQQQSAVVPCDEDQTPATATDVSMTDKKNDASLNSSTASRLDASLIENSGAEHEGYRCDLCQNSIMGFRYTCVECLNYDLCRTCEMRMEHSHHYILRVPSPRPYTEIQRVLQTINRGLIDCLASVTGTVTCDGLAENTSNLSEDKKPFDRGNIKIKKEVCDVDENKDSRRGVKRKMKSFNVGQAKIPKNMAKVVPSKVVKEAKKTLPPLRLTKANSVKLAHLSTLNQHAVTPQKQPKMIVINSAKKFFIEPDSLLAQPKSNVNFTEQDNLKKIEEAKKAILSIAAGKKVLIVKSPSKEDATRSQSCTPSNQIPLYAKPIDESPASAKPPIQRRFSTKPCTHRPLILESRKQRSPSTITLNESFQFVKPLEQSPVCTKPVNQSPISTKPLKQSPLSTSSSYTKQLKQDSPSIIPLKESFQSVKPLEQIPVFTKPINQSPVSTKPLKQSPLSTKPLKQYSSFKKHPKQNSPATKPCKDRSPSMKPPKQTFPSTKPHKHTTPTIKPLKYVTPTIKPFKHVTPTIKPLKYVTPTIKPPKKTPPNTKPLKTHSTKSLKTQSTKPRKQNQPPMYPSTMKPLKLQPLTDAEKLKSLNIFREVRIVLQRLPEQLFSSAPTYNTKKKR